MILMTIFFGAIYGCIVGFIWAKALIFDTSNGLIYGAIVGSIIGIVYGLYQKSLEVKAKQELRQLSRIIGNFFFMLLLLGVSSGLIAWLIRALFF